MAARKPAAKKTSDKVAATESETVTIREAVVVADPPETVADNLRAVEGSRGAGVVRESQQTSRPAPKPDKTAVRFVCETSPQVVAHIGSGTPSVRFVDGETYVTDPKQVEALDSDRFPNISRG